MEDGSKGPVFFSKELHYFWGWSYDGWEPCENLKCFLCNREVVKLAGPYIDDIRLFFSQKSKLAICQGGVPENSSAFPSLFL